MKLVLVPLVDAKERRLKDLFQSAPFQEFIDALTAQCEYETVEAKMNLVDFVFDPTQMDDARVKMMRAGRLKMALEVIREFTETGEHYTLQINQG